MSKSVVVPVVQSENTDDHVTISQCSNITIQSEEEPLPRLTTRLVKKIDKPELKGRPILKYTNNRETGPPFCTRGEAGSPFFTRKETGSQFIARKETGSPFFTRKETVSPFIKKFVSVEEFENNNEDVDLVDNETHQNACQDKKSADVVDEKIVFLPRLNDTELKQNLLNKRPIDADYIRFPEISNLSKRDGRLALNRSITDLLDPEMEILNKIKHLPRKKRKRRRKKFDSGTPV